VGGGGGVQARACACASVALLIHHATRRHIAISSLTGSTEFSTLSHKWHYSRKNVFERKMCILTSSTIFIRNICHSRKDSTRYFHKSEKSLCKVPIILVGL
jgi:hypothetical protein